MLCEAAGKAILDIGDFNEKMTSKDGFVALFPDIPTFRKKGSDIIWCSTLDGALVSGNIARDASCEPCPPVDVVQHRAVAITLHWSPHLFHVWRWVRYPRDSNTS